MPHQNQPNSRIDDYLDRIADRERQERRKKILLAVVGLAILAAGFTIVKNVDFSADLPYYGVNELPEGEIRSLFQDEDFQALFVHPLGKDTITSFADYLNLKAFLAEAGMTESTFTSDDGAVEEPPVENTLRVFSVDVSGSRTSGEKLRFVIEDYDPEIKYMLDFGNGFRREVGRISNYTYRRSGRFQLRLLATSETEGNSVYTKRIRISRAEQETEAPTETATPEPQASGDPIAENTEEVEPAPETATGEDEEVLASLDDLGSTTSERAEIDLNDSRSGDEGATEEIPGANDAPLLPSPEIEAAPVVTTPAPTTPVIDKPLVAADVMPEFPGGMKAMGNFFWKNNRYPTKARSNGIEGKVFVRFVVNKDGSLSDIAVLKGIGYGCDEEAIRLVKKMPRWIPGEQSGQVVSVYKTIPITFKLLND